MMKLPKWDKLPKAVALDLDGTLLDSRSRLSERNRKAIEGCIAQGIPVIIATSRPARAVRRFIPVDLASRCSLVMMNGAIASAAPPLSGSFRHTLSHEIARGIIALSLAIEPNVRFTIELEGYEFGTNWTADAETLWARNAATPGMVLSVEAALSRMPAKIAVGTSWVGTSKASDAVREMNLSHISARIAEKFGSLLSIVSSDNMTFLNITPANATKPEALRRLLGSKGISLRDVIAFGDDIPDLDMLSDCGISVAVANAVPEVKAVADFETVSNDENGVALVLEQMLERL